MKSNIVKVNETAISGNFPKFIPSIVVLPLLSPDLPAVIILWSCKQSSMLLSVLCCFLSISHYFWTVFPLFYWNIFYWKSIKLERVKPSPHCTTGRQFRVVFSVILMMEYAVAVSPSICVYLGVKAWSRDFVVEPTKLKLLATEQGKPSWFDIASVYIWGLLKALVKFYLLSECHFPITDKSSHTYMYQLLMLMFY